MSDLENLCRALEESVANLPGVAGTLQQRSARIRSLAAEVQQARSRVRCNCGPEVGNIVQGLHEAAGAVTKSAQSLTGAVQHSRNFVTRTIASGGGTGSGLGTEERGVSSGTGVAVLEDGTSTRGPAATEADQLKTLQDAFVAAHDPLTGELDVSKFIGKVNPDFEGYADAVGVHPHNINCGLTAQAVALTLDGRPHTAAGVAHGVSEPEMSRWTGKAQTVSSPSEIAEHLKGMPPGSHAIVGVDYEAGGGHWFNARYDGKSVSWLDGQNGDYGDWPRGFPGRIVKWDVIYTEGGSLSWQE